MENSNCIIAAYIVDPNVTTPLKLVKGEGNTDLILTGVNTYSGGTEIPAGRVRGNSVSPFGTGPVYISAGG